MRRGSNNRETPKGVPSSKNNRQLVTCRPFRDSCMRTKPNSYRHGSYRLGRVYRQGSKTLFHAYGPWTLEPSLVLQHLAHTYPYAYRFTTETFRGYELFNTLHTYTHMHIDSHRKLLEGIHSSTLHMHTHTYIINSSRRSLQCGFQVEHDFQK